MFNSTAQPSTSQHTTEQLTDMESPTIQRTRSSSEGNLHRATMKQNQSPTNDSCPGEVDNKNWHNRNSVNRPFFTLPRLLSSRRKRNKRKSIISQEAVTSIDERPETGSVGQNSTVTNVTFRSANVYVKENFFIRLMRHLASPVHGSGHNSYYNNDQNHLATIRRRSKQGSFVSSASNGDISRSQFYVGCNDNSLHRLPTSTNGLDVPAVCGIKNHGNTCFMNAVVQCLCNTDLLAEYFVMNHFKVDLSRHNKIHAKKYGTKGELTEQLALFLKSLWSGHYNPEISSKFKNLVSKYGSQYEGSEQHDSQEFLLWLLDKCHEDLNIANKKKYKKIKALAQNRSEELMAAETLANHMRCNSSFIHDLFQAQLKSTLVCRSCGKHSNTFDPYLCLSLPVPTRLTHTVVVTSVFLDRTPREVKIGVSIESLATLRELRDKISRLLKVPEKQLVLLLVGFDNELKELTKDTDVIQEILDDMENIIAVETPKMCHSTSNQNSLTNSAEQLLTLVWANRVGIGSQGKIFGPLFSCLVSREASFKQIQLDILNAMKSIIKKDVDINIVCSEDIIRLRVVDGIPGKCYLPEDVDHPLYMQTVDRALLVTEGKDYRGPVHLKLIVEWDFDARLNLLIEDEEIEKPVVDNSIEFVKSRSQRTNRATLQDCFQMYFKEEKLAADNAWMCPNCKRRQQCFKKLSLWSVPDIFIVHLKRFRHQQSNSQRSKLSTVIEFPLNGLDMTTYLAPRKHVNGVINNTLPAFWSPWKRPRMFGKLARSDDNCFDLYAVVNHQGNMQGGHYTAHCKNPIDGCWYSFDDTKVCQIQESAVVTAEAYILFYQRSSLSSSAISSCASSSTSGYSSASSYYNEHWAFRMPPFNYSWSTTKSSKSQDNLSQTSSFKDNSSEGPPHGIVSRGQRAYASLPLRIRPNRQTACDLENDVLTQNIPVNSSTKIVPQNDDSNEIENSLTNEQTVNEVNTNSLKVNEKYWTITSV